MGVHPSPGCSSFWVSILLGVHPLPRCPSSLFSILLSVQPSWSVFLSGNSSRSSPSSVLSFLVYLRPRCPFSSVAIFLVFPPSRSPFLSVSVFLDVLYAHSSRCRSFSLFSIFLGLQPHCHCSLSSFKLISMLVAVHPLRCSTSSSRSILRRPPP